MKKKMRKLTSLRNLLLSVVVLAAVTVGVSSCKATRSITTTTTCTICQDSTETRATITAKTVEDYQGVKKR